MGHHLSLGQHGNILPSPPVLRGRGVGGEGDARGFGPLTPGPSRPSTGERGEVDSFDFADIETAIRELKAGRMVVVVDDEDRENEGDLTMAAELVTPEAINFMATHGRGLICLAMPGERLDELDLAPMVPDNTALHGTAFTVSIDVKGHGVTTGISAHDRARTIRAAVNPGSFPDDFA